MTFTAWGGKIAFGPWWLLRSGPIGPTEAHSHHSIKIVVHGGAPCIADGNGEPVPGPLVVLGPDELHTIESHRDHALVVYVEPDSTVGRRLHDHVAPTAHSLGFGHPVGGIVGSLLPTNWSRVEEAVRRTLTQVGVMPPSEPIRWWRHPAFDEALTKLADSDEEFADGFTEATAGIGMPPSRLAHLFPTEVGIPLRPYARWLRLIRATEHLVDGFPLSNAARAAHFTSTAHLERSVTAMFGLTATELALAGTWIR